MQIAVLVEPVGGNGYRAKGAEPFGLRAEGATREEAVAKVQQLCEARLNGGAEVVTVEVGTALTRGCHLPACSKTIQTFRKLSRSWLRTGEKWMRTPPSHDTLCSRHGYIVALSSRGPCGDPPCSGLPCRTVGGERYQCGRTDDGMVYQIATGEETRPVRAGLPATCPGR